MIRAALPCGLACAALALGAASCSFDEDVNPAYGCEGCPAGACRDGFCFARGEDRGPITGNGDAATDAGAAGANGSGQAGRGGQGGQGGQGGTSGANGAPDAAMPNGQAGAGGQSPEPCAPGEFCYEGPAGTATVGRCRAGERRCDGEQRACLGQITPGEEICNGLDDDCDGSTDEDEDLMLGSCAAQAEGACAAGVLQCELGVSTCRSTVEPAPESCNGVDEDCDGATDEDASVACYPDGVSGCAPDSEDDGAFACEGACSSGTRACEDGALLPCAGFVAPAPEVCDGSVTGTGTDEDCDGETDESCLCLIGATQECYTGPAGTAGIGACVAGTQTCTDGTFGPCVGATMPVAETCANEGADDDCDGEPDDVRGRGMPCTIDANQGVCRSGTQQCQDAALACVTPEPADAENACDGRDEDCDGQVDEGFDLQTDEANCGACANACAPGETCCAGGCVDLSTDARHCGVCGTACGDGMVCCNGGCVDPLASTDHCGACGRACASGTSCCGGACTDLASNDANCGACGVDCTAIETSPGVTCSCLRGACTGLPGRAPCAL